ncbi:MAG: tetratricopeptide repeat protein, partial [Deltaproteobacteria bacterium]|nr:tetratricopeptide repeat protein [Deltaproteobacteria bacterium]
MSSKEEKILSSAQRLAEKGSFGKAAEKLRQLSRDHPDDVQLWLKIGELEEQANNQTAALEAFRLGLQLLLKENPSDARLWLKLGELEERAGKKDAAIEVYQKGAEIYAERASYLQAVAVYRNKLLAIAPEMVAARLHLAELYQHLGLLEEALAQYLEVASHHEQQGQVAEARRILQRVLDLKPDFLAAQLRLAELFIREKETDQATEQLSRICQQLRQAGKDADYLKVAERLVYLRPDDQQQTQELIRVLLGQGNTMRALHHLQRCLQIDPEDTVSLGLLAQTF